MGWRASLAVCGAGIARAGGATSRPPPHSRSRVVDGTAGNETASCSSWVHTATHGGRYRRARAAVHWRDGLHIGAAAAAHCAPGRRAGVCRHGGPPPRLRRTRRSSVLFRAAPTAPPMLVAPRPCACCDPPPCSHRSAAPCRADFRAGQPSLWHAHVPRALPRRAARLAARCVAGHGQYGRAPARGGADPAGHPALRPAPRPALVGRCSRPYNPQTTRGTGGVAPRTLDGATLSAPPCCPRGARRQGNAASS